MGTFNVLDKIIDMPTDALKQKIIDTVQSDKFRQYNGSGANKRDKLVNRINTIQNALLALIDE